MSDRVLGISPYGRHLIALREELAGRGVRCLAEVVAGASAHRPAV